MFHLGEFIREFMQDAGRIIFKCGWLLVTLKFPISERRGSPCLCLLGIRSNSSNLAKQ